MCPETSLLPENQTCLCISVLILGMLSNEDFHSTLNFLRQSAAQTEKWTNVASDRVKDLILYQLKWELKLKIGPKFYDGLEKCLKSDSSASLEHFTRSVNNLFVDVSKFWSLAEGQESNLTKSDVVLHMKALLFYSISASTFKAIRSIYKRAFMSFYQLQLRGTSNTDEASFGQLNQCSACEKVRTKCICWALVEKFRLCNAQLLELDLLDRLAGDAVVQIAQSTIEDQVISVCNANFALEHLPALSKWLTNTILPWLYEVYGLTSSDAGGKTDTNNSSIAFSTDYTADKLRRRSYDYQARRLVYHLHDILGNYLIEHLFPIIVDFPDTTPAVQDLKSCLERVDLRRKLTFNIRNSLERRLLHPGVNTSDILTAYVQTVKTLRSIDPSGVMMDDVCSSVRKYLRCRPDTVRCIVSFVTDGHGLSAGDPDLMQNNYDPMYSDSDSENEMSEDWRLWRPDPVGVTHRGEGSRFSKKSADIIGMLVEVYGSRELFVREYSQLLAERLLKITNYEVENELRYLELLKKRFGESEMHLCEVMLKDVKDSQQVDSFVKASNDSIVENVSALVISAQFWPQLKEDSVELPPAVHAAFESYCKWYESFKASRSLDWKTNLGIACLEIELNGQMCKFNVSPILASIIWLFQEKSRWTLDELCSKLKVSPSILKRRISWWCSSGLLKPVGEATWVLCDRLSCRPHNQPAVTAEDEEESDALLSDEDREKQLEIYWPYIMGLLKNLESLSAERIFNLLKMFGSQKKDELTIDMVHNFLQRKVREQLLTHASGVYRLLKK